MLEHAVHARVSVHLAGDSASQGEAAPQVTTRTGNPAVLEDLDLVSAGKAQRVLVFPPESDSDGPAPDGRGSSSGGGTLARQVECVRSLQALDRATFGQASETEAERRVRQPWSGLVTELLVGRGAAAATGTGQHVVVVPGDRDSDDLDGCTVA